MDDEVAPSLGFEPGATVSAWPEWGDEVDDLDRARYISLTTFKKDGSPVSSPVWITGAGGTYEFTTGGKAWKTLRLLRNPSVRVQVCDMRGRVEPQASTYVGMGEVASSADAVAAAERALAAKYGWQFHGIKIFEGLKGRLSRKGDAHQVAIRLSLRDG